MFLLQRYVEILNPNAHNLIWKKHLCRYKLGGNHWGSSNITSVLLRRENLGTNKHRGKYHVKTDSAGTWPCDDGGRDWSDAVTRGATRNQEW